MRFIFSRLSPAIEHHDVVLGPADEEVGVLQVGALLLLTARVTSVRRVPGRPGRHAAIERDGALPATGEPVHGEPGVHLSMHQTLFKTTTGHQLQDPRSKMLFHFPRCPRKLQCAAKMVFISMFPC